MDFLANWTYENAHFCFEKSIQQAKNHILNYNFNLFLKGAKYAIHTKFKYTIAKIPIKYKIKFPLTFNDKIYHFETKALYINLVFDQIEVVKMDKEFIQYFNKVQNELSVIFKY